MSRSAKVRPLRTVPAGVLLVLLVGTAAAQGPLGGKGGQALRLAGIIDPASCTQAPCLGILELQVGQQVRKLGVTMAQTDKDEGMFIFRGFALQSQPLRLLAPKTTVQPLLDAAPGTPVRMWGMFQGLTLVVADLKVEPATGPTPAVPPPTP